MLHELLRGARTVTERKFVLEVSRRCQVLTPTEQQWLKAAEIIDRLSRREHYEAAKLHELAFDVLIALSARSIGASVITTTHADFLAIQRELEVKSPEDFPKHSPLRFEIPLSLKKVYSYLCSASFAEHAVKFSSLRITPSRCSRQPA
ncbi:MAG: PIN domain-containing protein [Nitrospira sp.]|nr:PIN domain-containing protein [Nitrospira sp.]